ncbi:MAG TPA: hypothetical protein VLL51_10080 [Gemmatimonadales bacterium]|nr:hypothetical protein [Gemmatimonadales bacterium]
MMIVDTNVWDPLRRFLERVAGVLPVLLAVMIVVVAGLVLAWLLDLLTRTVLRAVGFDRLAKRVEVSDALRRAGLIRLPSALAGYVVRWVTVVLTLVAALSFLSAEATDTVLGAMVNYMPRLAAALLIVVVGYAVSAFLARSVLLWAVNSRLVGARLLARGVQGLTAVFFAALALENLGFGRTVALVVLAILLGGGVLALALAYGLAGKELARESLDLMLRDVRDEERDTLSHL